MNYLENYSVQYILLGIFRYQLISYKKINILENGVYLS